MKSSLEPDCANIPENARYSLELSSGLLKTNLLLTWYKTAQAWQDWAKMAPATK